MGFAVGGLWNRMCDWFDWMMPEAWNVEHNNRHHYCLGELEDPDLVENNLKDMRDINDFMHGYLNYQIEHHLWPNLSMLSYKRSQPLVKALCKSYGVPYVQENVFLRVKKTVDIMTGVSSMKFFPAEYERKFLDRDAV